MDSEFKTYLLKNIQIKSVTLSECFNLKQLLEMCKLSKIESVDISKIESVDISKISESVATNGTGASCATCYYTKIDEEKKLQVVFFCEDYRLVVEMSKHAKITGLVCIGLPENIEWIKDMRNFPEYFILCGETFGYDGISRYTYLLREISARFSFINTGYLSVLCSCKKIIPFTEGDYEFRINKNGLWAEEKPVVAHIEFTVCFTENGTTFFKYLTISRNSLYYLNVTIHVEFVKNVELEHSPINIDAIFSIFSKKDYYPIVQLRQYQYEMNKIQEENFELFLNSLLSKTIKDNIFIVPSHYRITCKFLDRIKYRVVLHVRKIFDVEKHVVPSYCSDLYILSKTYSRVLLNENLQYLNVLGQLNKKEDMIILEGSCPNLKRFVYKNTFDWEKDMKTFLLGHTNTEFIYLDFGMEVNGVEPRCSIDFFNPKDILHTFTWIFKCFSGENYVVLKEGNTTKKMHFLKFIMYFKILYYFNTC